jgi:endonuclease/exonuclease/phosphatase (EEP) superfamily protein YafD
LVGRKGPATTPADKVGSPLRVLCWNLNGVAGGVDTVLDRMAGLQPDLCFVQEVWGGKRDLPADDIRKHLPGWHWLVEPDCGVLSRYPASPREPVAPDGRVRAQVVQIELPSSRSVTCINVHLPLYPLRLAIWKQTVRSETRTAVASRREAMAQLGGAVESYLDRGPVIVAGDWNVPARARSLRPIAAQLRDAFRLGGSGWGNTMTNDFPISRIDAIFVSPDIDVIHCRAHKTETSDHRLLEAELWLRLALSSRRTEHAAVP